MRKVYLLLLSFIFLSGFSFANDLCANAVVLTPSPSCNYTTSSFSGATISTPLPSCASSASQDVWFSFVATTPTNMVSLNAVSGLNHGFEIIDGSCTGTILVCVNSNSAGNAESNLRNAYVVGNTYFVRVFNANAGVSTAGFGICITSFATPANDLCANAISLTPSATCNYTNGTFSGSGITTSGPSCAPSAPQDVWYSFVATDPTMSVSLGAVSGLDHGFEIFEGSCTGTSMRCDNDNGSSSGEFHIANNFTVGQTYYVRVFKANTGLATVGFTICVQSYPTPSNDLCANAISLTTSATCNYTNGTFSGSGVTTSGPSCAPSAPQDVWYSFVATDPTMSVSLGAVSGLDHGFEIFEGSCTGTNMRCDDDNSSSSGEFHIANNFTVGQTYYVRVFKANTGLTTAGFTICIQSYPTPANDLCANAISLTTSATCNYTNGTFSGSGITTAAPACAPSASQDVWYSFVATDPTMSVSLGAVSGLDHGFEIFEGSCTGTNMRCDNDNSSSSSEFHIANNFTVGQTYYVRVFKANAGLTTAGFTICVQSYPTPANDLCANAISLAPSANCNYTNGTFSGSGITTSAPACAPNASQDVWYSFVATDPTMSVSLGAVSGLDHGFEIFEGSCTGTNMRCDNDNSSSSSEFYIANNFTVGQTYYVRVFKANAGLTTAGFTICVQSYPTPANDLCANAISLTPAATCNYTTGTFSGSGITTSAPACAPNASQDVWYSFVATEPTMSVTIDAVSGLDHGFEIFAGSCTGTSIRCDNDNGSGSNEFYQSNTFTVGQTYYVRVFKANAGLATVGFSICVRSYTSSANDACSAATALTPGANCTYYYGSFSGTGISTPAPACAPNASQDIWFSFVATQPTMSVSLEAVSGLNHAFELIEGSCTGTSLYCANANGSSLSEFYQNNTFTVGQTYYVRVLNTAASLTTVSVGICIRSYVTATNDLCGNAVSLTPGTTCTYTYGSFSGTGISTPAPACAPNASQDIWFSFVATQPTMSISLEAVSGLNHAFELIEGSCTGTSLYCANANGSSLSEFYQNNTFTVGQTYYVRVLNTAASLTTASFGICIRSYVTATNDLCGNAVSLTPATTCTYTYGSFSGTGISTPAPACAPNSGQDVWYSFVATDSTMSISLEAVSGLNHGFELYAGSCNGTVIACVNSNGSAFSEFYMDNQFAIGQTYYIRVLQTTSALSTLTFGICVRNYPAPANNYCANAQVITPNTLCIYTNASLSGASISTAAPACAPNASQDIWFQFTATDAAMSLALEAENGLNHGLEIFAGSCNGTSIACENANGLSFSEYYYSGAFQVGTTYFVRVFNVNAGLSTGNIGICLQNYSAPANDLCAGAVTLTPAAACNYTFTSFTNSQLEGNAPACAASASQDVWASFTATSANQIVTLSAVSGLNHGFEIYEGSCNGNLVVCQNASGSNQTETYNGTTFTAGQVYVVRIFNAGATVSTANVGICVQEITCTPGISIASSSGAAICANETVTFTSTVQNAGTNPQYTWLVNTTAVGTGASFQASGLQNGDMVTCELVSNAACATIPTVTSAPITISVTSINTAITNNNTSLSAVQSGATYQWVNCATGFTPVSGAVAQQFAPTANGTYAVIISLNGCSDTSSCETISTLGVDEAALVWDVYPNPSNGTFVIRGTALADISEVALMAADGKRLPIQTSIAYVSATECRMDCRVETPATGLYFLQLRTTDGRLVMQRIELQ